MDNRDRAGALSATSTQARHLPHLAAGRRRTGRATSTSSSVPYRKGANVISCLMEIQRNPVTADGRKVAPVIWDAACLEEVCGSCAMNINGRVRMACSALVDKLEQPDHPGADEEVPASCATWRWTAAACSRRSSA